jgi:hypothetical protein
MLHVLLGSCLLMGQEAETVELEAMLWGADDDTANKGC